MNPVRKFLLVCLIAAALVRPSGADETSRTAHASPLAGARSEGEAGRKYAPDREVDIIHLKLDITPDFDGRTLEGTAFLTFTPVSRPVDRLVLDAVDLEIHSVEGTPNVRGVYVGPETLELTFDEPLQPGEEGSVSIVYSAEPQKGLYFRMPELGYLPGDEHLWTQGETHEARYWYPSVDYPNERFSSELICRVPRGMVARSNGRLLGADADEEGFVAWHWLQEKAHPNYLVALVAGRLAGVEDQHGEIPMAFWTAPSQAHLAPRAFAETGAIMAFLEKEIGLAFPWAKYDQAAVQDYLYGGMENTTLTVLTDRILYPPEVENVREATGLIAHELAHQWFGDYVTCKDWSHAWLNEGFATYYTWLYEGKRDGESAMRYAMWGSAEGIARRSDGTRPIVHREYERGFDQFSFRAYQKGGWVLHMLREELGEELFRRGIRLYLERHALDSVVTEDLNQALEDISGRSLDRFFDQWVYHAGIPELDVRYQWNGSTRKVRLTVSQTQKTSEGVLLFDLPLTVRFDGEGWSREETVRLRDREEDFYFAFEQAPRVVIIDPNQALLARVDFKPGRAMLLEQLNLGANDLARAKAAHALRDEKAAVVVEALGKVLGGDPFYGARLEAASSLRRIGTDEAIKVLAGNLDQDDARVRLRVVEALAGAYDPIARDRLLDVARSDSNPYIVTEALGGLAAYPERGIDALLAEKMESDSHQQVVAMAAMEAARDRDAGELHDELLTLLRGETSRFPRSAHARALEILGFLARDEESREEIRDFLVAALESPVERVRAGALRGLGELGDPGALAAVDIFTEDGHAEAVREAAREASERLRAGKPAESRVGELRRELLDMKQETDDLQKKVERLEKQLQAGDSESEGDKPRRRFLGLF